MGQVIPMDDLFYRLGMATIDICLQVVAKSGGRVPGTYKDCFTADSRK